MTKNEQVVLAKLATSLEALDKKLDILVSLQSAVQEQAKTVKPSEDASLEKLNSRPTSASSSIPQYPIPTEYRDTINTVLNSKFGLEITPMSDSPAYQLTIVVPLEYSDAPPEYLKMYGRDIRPKVITYAEGGLGVREWANRVLSSFKQDVQTKIALDRAQLKGV